jgi:hypothetical protein
LGLAANGFVFQGIDDRFGLDSLLVHETRDTMEPIGRNGAEKSGVVNVFGGEWFFGSNKRVEALERFCQRLNMGMDIVALHPGVEKLADPVNAASR